MKKLMLAALAVASCNAFAAAAPEPECKAYNATVTEKWILPVMVQMTKKNIPTDELVQVKKDIEKAAPNFPAVLPGGGWVEKPFTWGDETTNKNGTVTIKWTQCKEAKNGTNVVVATKVYTITENLIFLLDEDNTMIEAIRYDTGAQTGEDGFKYKYIGRPGDYEVEKVTLTGDGKATVRFGHRWAGGVTAVGHGTAAKSNPADKSASYDYPKSVAGGFATETGVYGTWKWSYDKKLSQAYAAAYVAPPAGSPFQLIALARFKAAQEALKSKKIYIDINDFVN